MQLWETNITENFLRILLKLLFFSVFSQANLVYREKYIWLVIQLEIFLTLIRKYIVAVARRCYVKNRLWKISQNSQEYTCGRVSFLIKLQVKDCNFIAEETLAQVFSWEFCKISKKTFSYRTPLWLLLSKIDGPFPFCSCYSGLILQVAFHHNFVDPQLLNTLWMKLWL